MSVKVLEEEECRALKMGSYLGVAQGSIHPPQFIHLTYKPKGESYRGAMRVREGSSSLNTGNE